MLRSESIAELMKALAKAQNRYTKVMKDARNEFQKYDYATLASILEAVRDALSENGIALMQGLSDIEPAEVLQTIKANGRDEGVPQKLPGVKVKAWTELRFGDEFVRTENWWFTAKTDPQAMGSLQTYARKYQLQALVGCAPDQGTDDDGQSVMIRDNGRGDDRRQYGSRESRNLPEPGYLEPGKLDRREPQLQQQRRPPAPAKAPAPTPPKAPVAAAPAPSPAVTSPTPPAPESKPAAPPAEVAQPQAPKTTPVPDGDPPRPGAPAWHSWASRDLIWWMDPLMPQDKAAKQRSVNALLSPWQLRASELQGISQQQADDILFSLKSTHEKLVSAGSTSAAAISTMVAAAEAAGGAA